MKQYTMPVKQWLTHSRSYGIVNCFVFMFAYYFTEEQNLGKESR